MARFAKLGPTLLLICAVAVGQQAPEKGAKAIFLDTQSGRMAMPIIHRTARTSSSVSVGIPEITGLMYYFELLQPNGELVRVNSSRVFRSGEKVRLHVTTNIEGRLTILQSQDGGKFEGLFPSSKTIEAAALVGKGVDTVLPAPGGWFKFDERTGEVRLLMMLTAGREAAPTTNLAGFPPRTEIAHAESSSSVDGRIDAMLALERLQRGSKALLIETDDTPRGALEVMVVNSREDRTMPPGQIVVELKLHHRSRV